MSERYRVVGHKSSLFEIADGDIIRLLPARGNLKKRGNILVGDLVTVKSDGDFAVIDGVCPRKNSLIRPAVANIDAIVILIAPVPQPDYYLVDKLIINCKRADIDCVLCLNKSDIGGLDEAELKKQFSRDVAAVVSISAAQGQIDELLNALCGYSLVAFAGQSAVGKSTLSNAIVGSGVRETGVVSEKTERGKNTTTSAALIRAKQGFYFIDTPGFSMLDSGEDEHENLWKYYDEYVELADECKFHPCNHYCEPGCAVSAAAESGRISAARYERYKKIFDELKSIKKY